MKYFLIFGILFSMSCNWKENIKYTPNTSTELHYAVYQADGKTPYSIITEVEVVVINNHDYLGTFRGFCHSATCRFCEQNKK